MTGGDATEARPALARELVGLEPVPLGIGAKGVDDPIELTRRAKLSHLAQSQQCAVRVLPVLTHSFDERQVLVEFVVAPLANRPLHEHTVILQHCNSPVVEVSPLQSVQETATSHQEALVSQLWPPKIWPDPLKSGRIP